MSKIVACNIMLLVMTVCICTGLYFAEETTIIGKGIGWLYFIGMLVVTYVINNEVNPEKGMLYKEKK